MYQLNKLLVCLDLTDMDDMLIKYSSFLAHLLGSEKVIFMHTIQSQHIAEELMEYFPDMEEPLEDLIKKELNEKVKANFDKSAEVEQEIKVVEGSPTDMVLKEADNQDVDLAVLGKKTGFKGQGILTDKIVRLVHCSVLILPETSRPSMDQVLVPVDFSKYSQMALKQANELAKKSDASITCQNVYSIPTHYFPYISSSKNLDKPMLDHAKKEYKKFLRKAGREVPKNIPCEYTKDEGQDPAQKIYDFAVKNQIDLIVIGSKGVTDTASYLIGSTAEKLTSHDKHIPILIFKDKEANFGLLDFLFNR